MGYFCLFYRKLAQKWHPDNFQDEDEKKKAEKKFMDIAAAKEVLTDPGTYKSFFSTIQSALKLVCKINCLKVHSKKCD